MSLDKQTFSVWDSPLVDIFSSIQTALNIKWKLVIRLQWFRTLLAKLIILKSISFFSNL
jgi:hypothetical protein